MSDPTPGLDESAGLGDAEPVLLWIAVTAVVVAVATWQVAAWANTPAVQPMNEALRADLLDQLTLLGGDQCRRVCRQMAVSPLAEQLVLQRALDELPVGRGEGEVPGGE